LKYWQENKSPAFAEDFVASSVIGYEDQVDRVCGLFEQLGYHPIYSYYKTMPVDPSKSNLLICRQYLRNNPSATQL
jgi:hypothetical protein